MSNSTDTLKMMFVEEFEKAFGKPKPDGIRENVMGASMNFGSASDSFCKHMVQSHVQRLNMISPFADVELLSLESEREETNEYGTTIRSVTIEYLVDEATADAVRALTD